MPSISDSENGSGSGNSLKPPPEEVIPSSSCCGRCLYNIPQGTLIILIPGVMILFVGALLTSLLEADSSYDGDIRRTAHMLMLLGGLMTVAGVAFWLSMWRQQQRQRRQLQRKTIRGDVCDGGVQLVGVYRVPDMTNVVTSPEMADSTRAAVT